MNNDLTKGSITGGLIRFAIPLFLGQLLQQFYNMADTVIVGKFVGTKALAAVGSTGTIMFLILGFVLGMTAGFTVLTAQKFGAGDMKAMRQTVGGAAVLSILVTIVLTVGSMLFMKPLLHFMHTPADIFDDAYSYIMIICAGIAAQMLYNLLASVLRALGNSKVPLYFLILSALLNIVLDPIFIFTFHLGIAGAAIATISAQAISGLLCLFFISRRVKLLLPTKENRTLRKDAAQELLAMGIPTGLQFSITAIGSMVMQSANNGLGSVYVSAFTAAMKIKQFMMCPFDAISTAASVFCSQNLGAGQSKRIRQGLRQGVLVGVGYGAFAGVIMILFGRPLTKLFIVSSAFEAINASAKYLRCLGFFYWMLGILNVCRMVTQGLGYSGRAVFSGVMEMLARTIVCLGFVGAFGFTAICFADQAAWLAACCYIAPTCLYCVKKSTKMIADRGAK